MTTPFQAAEWIQAKGVSILNVAGNRESVAPGIGERAERFMVIVLRKIRR